MIKIITVGQLKEKYLKDAVEEYKKRLSKYTNLEIIEIKDEGLVEEFKAIELEGEKINKYLDNKDYIITLEIEGKQMSSVEFSEKLERIQIENSNIVFIIGGSYGLSETIVIGTGTVIRPEDYREADRFESVGHPVCFSEVKIVDEDDSSKILPQYEQGEIALRGPAVAKGYWGNEEKTKASFLDDGWFLTGDIGYLDEDNRLFITDRKKDMIVMSGWKIYPTEVEEVLIKYPEVKEIAIFSINDCHRGEIPVAAVVWENESDEEGLINFARENLSRYKVPRKIFPLDELPRVNGWKLLRRELRKMFKEWK